MNKKKILCIGGRMLANGYDIEVEGRRFDVQFPSKIWTKTPLSVRKALTDNLIYVQSHFLPLILGYDSVQYKTAFPFLEPFFFRNQIYDLPDCEINDAMEAGSYIKHFFNLDLSFEDNHSRFPDKKDLLKSASRPDVAIVPFSFGKESLATAALCKELGIEPVLVYCQEPSQPYEQESKLKRLKKMSKEMGIDSYFIVNGPGLFRYDVAFGKKPGTEIGWGAQMTILSLLMLPFVYYYKARYILYGSEYMNNRSELHKGWKVHYSYDNSSFWTIEQGNMIKLLTNGVCDVRSFLEPLEEASIMYLLNHRYPEYAKYYTSCFGKKPYYGSSYWCHDCYKCHKMYLLGTACGFDPRTIGFEKDLFKEPNFLEEYFKGYRDVDSDFAFYLLYKKGFKNSFVQKFVRMKLHGLRSWNWHASFFTGVKDSYTLPDDYKSKMYSIFKKEMRGLAAHIKV
ncbi:MAG: hypothetical protein HYY51_04015 [Candidatus Magasanikbacteria bacterium]|nr:hypothetical protein [Candidatus Magasanikbacteria bacterium]